MGKPLSVHVRFQDHSFHAALERGERADSLLLKSLHHFGLPPEQKTRWRLTATDRDESRRVLLDRPVGDQLGDGAELRLEENTAENRSPATGSY